MKKEEFENGKELDRFALTEFEDVQMSGISGFTSTIQARFAAF